MAQSDNNSALDKELSKGLHELEQQLEFYRRRGYNDHAEHLDDALKQLRSSKKINSEDKTEDIGAAKHPSSQAS